MGSFTIEKKDKGYLLFTITRNEKRNAINYEVMEGLLEAIDQTKDSRIKALVITGSGDQAFCSGGDLSVFHLLKTKEEAHSMLAKMAAILVKIATLPIPTVALINGAAIGGGMELASACDFRLAQKKIKAGFVQGNQAITTGWGGGSLLSEKLPAASAMQLLMNASLLSAMQLKRLGFIDELYESMSLDACEQFLEKMLSIEKSVLNAYKEIWLRKWENNQLFKRIEEEVQRCSILWESEAHHLYVKKFIDKNLNKL
ncbi:enoyl-CoA hydratase/isomerase family protein [Bacillota bacterium Lsc_1132]